MTIKDTNIPAQDPIFRKLLDGYKFGNPDVSLSLSGPDAEVDEPTSDGGTGRPAKRQATEGARRLSQASEYTASPPSTISTFSYRSSVACVGDLEVDDRMEPNWDRESRRVSTHSSINIIYQTRRQSNPSSILKRKSRSADPLSQEDDSRALAERSSTPTPTQTPTQAFFSSGSSRRRSGGAASTLSGIDWDGINGFDGNASPFVNSDAPTRRRPSADTVLTGIDWHGINHFDGDAGSLIDGDAPTRQGQKSNGQPQHRLSGPSRGLFRWMRRRGEEDTFLGHVKAAEDPAWQFMRVRDGQPYVLKRPEVVGNGEKWSSQIGGTFIIFKAKPATPPRGA